MRVFITLIVLALTLYLFSPLDTGNETKPTQVQPPIRQTQGLSVVGPPTITIHVFRWVLLVNNSPALNDADEIYREGIKAGIDPAILLAVFAYESNYGTRGMATETLSIGNIRATPGYKNHRGYRAYSSWLEGAKDWYKLIKNLYIKEWGLTTVEEIIPVYAPKEDNNDPVRYSATVRKLIAEWRSRGV